MEKVAWTRLSDEIFQDTCKSCGSQAKLNDKGLCERCAGLDRNDEVRRIMESSWTKTAAPYTQKSFDNHGQSAKWLNANWRQGFWHGVVMANDDVWVDYLIPDSIKPVVAEKQLGTFEEVHPYKEKNNVILNLQNLEKEFQQYEQGGY
jgi:hypothetical protein